MNRADRMMGALTGDRIVRCVSVTCSSSREALLLTSSGWVQYINQDVLEGMPSGSLGEKWVVFFKTGRPMSNDDLGRELSRRKLVAADPCVVITANMDRSLSGVYPNGTHWKSKGGVWCYLAFSCLGDERYVTVDSSGGYWDDKCWYVGVSQ
jgi:hypothetical protein